MKLYHSLSKVSTLGIKTREQLLLHKDLYAEIFLDIDLFITQTALRSKKNVERLHELKKLGVDPEDIHSDALKRCIDNLDKVLSKDLEFQIPYMYTICNNIIIDSYRKAIKETGFIVSLDDALNSHEANDDSKKSTSLNDHLMDPKASPENLYEAKASAKLYKPYILDIFQKHRNNADNLICALSRKVFGEKPRELADLLIYKGSVDKALVAYKEELSEHFGINESEYPAVAPAKSTGLSKILRKDAPDSREVSNKISNILNRTK